MLAATIRRQTPPNLARGRAFQLSPSVKCSDCNKPVRIHELGEHVCTANIRLNNPPVFTPPTPSLTHREIENEATNRIPLPEPRSRSLQESSTQNIPDRTQETITDVGGPTFGSSGSKPSTCDWSSYHPTVESYLPDGPVESREASLIDSTVSPPFSHPRYIDNTPARASRIFPSLEPALQAQVY